MKRGTNPVYVRSRTIVTPEGPVDGTVLVRDGRIEAVVPSPGDEPLLTTVGSDGSGGEIVEAFDLAVLPGLVDTHVHINEPGRTEWEGFQTATRAAAAGGVTTLVDMPLNAIPATTTAEAVEAKRTAMRGQLHVDCGLYGGLVPDDVDALDELLATGVFGLKAFMVDSGVPEFPSADEKVLEIGMRKLAGDGRPLLVHAEWAPAFRKPEDGSLPSYAAYARTRPPRSERKAVKRLLRLQQAAGCRLHVVHVSAAGTLKLLAEARADGRSVSAETCPHYLFFRSDEIPDGATAFKCAPPIRGKKHRKALWGALRDGTLDMIVSDHSPSPPELKALDSGDLAKAWGGIAGLELGLSVVWTAAKDRGCDLEDLARWMAGAPAELVGLSHRKGAIEPGRDADLVLFDPEAEWTVSAEYLRQRHKVTPYDGLTLSGRVVATFLGGRRVFADGRVFGDPRGNALVYEHAHAAG